MKEKKGQVSRMAMQTKSEWWKEAAVYQIYPRSFQDTNGDGIGDLNGIRSRLDYIRELGADTIWLCPIYDSPNDDNGYDIRNYRKIHPEFGTMEEFELLLSECHARGLRLIMDLVVNHTSDEHPWFMESRESKESPYRDYYIWKDGKPSGEPNNWGSWFGGSAWQPDGNTDQYYLHIFSRKQPDLNWRNPDVRNQVYEMMRWWMDKGVDGFRMDVINLISKTSDFSDGPINGIYGDLSPCCINGPHVHEYLQEMHREVLAHYDCMTVGETPGVTVEEARKYAGAQREELNMVFQFEHTGLSDGPNGKWSTRKTPLPALKAVFAHWQTGLYGQAWNCLFWGNHDQPRAVSKFGSDRPEYRELSAKMLAACLYLMQGTAYIYQGEELGMTNVLFDRIDEYKDIETLNIYKEYLEKGIFSHEQMMDCIHAAGRDNARTPMQWDDTVNGGFTSGTPWIRSNPNYTGINAGKAVNDPDSVYHFYRKVLALRKAEPVIREGGFSLLWPEHEQLFAYTRSTENETLFCLCNFSEDTVRLPEVPWSDRPGRVILKNYETAGEDSLRPFEVVVYVLM